MNNSRESVVTIKTPEGIMFSLRLAGPVTRFMAWLMDIMVIVTILFLLSHINSLLVNKGVLSGDMIQAATMLIYFFLTMGYGIVLEWFFRGQTLGKRLFKLRVMDEQGLSLQFSQVVIRNLVRVVDILPGLYMLGGICVLLSPRMQRLGDFAARTIVVWNKQAREPDLKQLFAGKYNSFREYPHLVARLRHRVSPREAGMALQALIRRDEFNPEARLGLFKEIAEHFRSVQAFPPEATEGISHEQYVRNVVDVLFRTKN